ncbi:hypothetical protein M459_0211390 [Staphylococcus epidermidis Scl25]|uniref:Uncharacterized protein n=3 Tax=Staphylococcus epidermidis TaxID=1282 RepID=Q5HKU9_STAEQ|nr:hypothetical protein SE_2211 [Staphylococcus epidermidis ATCC 12228]AAW53102.1 hypothetical protein SERP2243 [Staphylococcus epidermidis RP62A]ARG65660.1 hypothetical protein B4U56_01400 [Staphylococcus epidermidis]EES57477.1 hypothetical protein HMPREF0789_1951 [Staphylococcus epidermidis BCM-HMP0060]EFA87004.1 hypothetical protein HMPREF0797_0676 [Staphylococcus epidermidis SK135]EFE58868.1 hypothetical protein HMPREF0794_1299 [Staphylococcus epidermidis M23864:W2(grey)]EGG67322.1 hypoth
MCRLICIFGIFNLEVKTNSKTIAMAKDMIKFIKKGVLRMIY